MLLYLATDFPDVAKSPTAKHGVECYSATRDYSKNKNKKSVFITNARVKKKRRKNCRVCLRQLYTNERYWKNKHAYTREVDRQEQLGPHAGKQRTRNKHGANQRQRTPKNGYKKKRGWSRRGFLHVHFRLSLLFIFTHLLAFFFFFQLQVRRSPRTDPKYVWLTSIAAAPMPHRGKKVREKGEKKKETATKPDKTLTESGSPCAWTAALSLSLSCLLARLESLSSNRVQTQNKKKMKRNCLHHETPVQLHWCEPPRRFRCCLRRPLRECTKRR